MYPTLAYSLYCKFSLVQIGITIKNIKNQKLIVLPCIKNEKCGKFHAKNYLPSLLLWAQDILV